MTSKLYCHTTSFLSLIALFLLGNVGFPDTVKAQDTIKPTPVIPVIPKKKMTVPDYIERYKDVAVREMERSGIPASVTLAQGIHESGCGNSKLATEANNHFGIKCHKEWTGPTYYQWDDDPTESCFRVYENADQSYIDHTDFLQTRERYSFLFNYDKTDYEKWAKGLKKAGYATDPTYPDKLINTIQKHKLNDFDLAMSPIVLSKLDSTQTTPGNVVDVYVRPDGFTRKLRRKTRSPLFKEYKKGFYRQNGSTYATAREGETALEVATRFDIPYRKFLLFNDLVDGDLLLDFQPCYIQPKKTRYKGEESYHKVTDNVTMYEIAQYYGLKLSDLLERNMMKEGQEPKNGELIMLNEKVTLAPALRDSKDNDVSIIGDTTSSISVVPQFPNNPKDSLNNRKGDPSTPLLLNQPTYSDKVYNSDTTINTTINPDVRYNDLKPKTEKDPVRENPTTWKPEAPKRDTVINTKIEDPKKNNELDIVIPETPVITKPENPKPQPPQPQPNPNPTTEEYTLHTVKPKETLYSLSRLYGVNWQRIKEYNGLTSDTLRENQVLKIPKK